jgi:hypothetical protein
MSDEKALYWLTQVIGWFLFVLLILFQNFLLGQVDVGIVSFLIVNYIIGIGLSHFMRYVILQFGMLRMKIYQVLPRILLLSVGTGVSAAILIGTISDLFFKDAEQIMVMPFNLLLELVVPFTVVFLIWNILYFATIYLKNYEKEEVKNLRLEASMNEVELGNLRSQLNPHFIFNALNSIRALVDENPNEAKAGITKMSSILRSSLASGRKQFVTLEEEMKTVHAYLDLEKIRFEERLNYSFDIPAELNSVQLPPMLIQTLVENAIKHGISDLPLGGDVIIDARKLNEALLEIRVMNSGKYDPIRRKKSTSNGIGLTNSRRRLQLLYGTKSNIAIYNEGDRVICDITIPLTPKSRFAYEDSDN